MKEHAMPDDLYARLAESPAAREGREDRDPPGTLHTASIETIDNDRAGSLLGPVGP
jgi:hypothetical protein